MSHTDLVWWFCAGTTEFLLAIALAVLLKYDPHNDEIVFFIPAMPLALACWPIIWIAAVVTGLVLGIIRVLPGDET